MGTDDIHQCLPIGCHHWFPMMLSRHCQTNKEFSKAKCGKRKKVYHGGSYEGKKLVCNHLSSLLTLSDDPEMNSYLLGFVFILWKIRNVISWGRVFLTSTRERKTLVFSSNSGVEMRMENLFQSPVASNRTKSETSISHCALSVTITAL